MSFFLDWQRDCTPNIHLISWVYFVWLQFNVLSRTHWLRFLIVLHSQIFLSSQRCLDVIWYWVFSREIWRSCPHWNVAKTGGHTPQLGLQFCAHAQTRTFCRSITRLDYGRRHFLQISWWTRNSSIGALPMHDPFLMKLGISIFW